MSGKTIGHGSVRFLAPDEWEATASELGFGPERPDTLGVRMANGATTLFRLFGVVAQVGWLYRGLAGVRFLTVLNDQE